MPPEYQALGCLPADQFVPDLVQRLAVPYYVTLLSAAAYHGAAFAVNELLATKLRALYQRKKGRDLFDLWLAIEKGVVDPPTLLASFQRYMTEGGHEVSRAQFEANLHEKRSAPVFRADLDRFLRPGLTWDCDTAMDVVLERIVAHLPGAAWKGATR
ncbi:MAG: nucleotidyl transferase AbiEii/AbiGii toxin family protein [Polyangiaceae bacterium]|nr:nucleotidyl transferase AbiEii/AbiGii toxin family protein [Polyangiaceae bacterium]